MRIGELAALAGVSTRTVRHYHQLGLLPEPARLANGYREYRLRDAVVLARVRRLAELGLALEEIRDVLAGEVSRPLREVIAELDADLARQQEAIATRRARLAALLAEASLHPDSTLHPDATLSPDMSAVLAGLSSSGSAFAQLDRDMLTLVSGAAAPEDRDRVLALIRPLTEPAALAAAHALYAQLDELAGAGADDPRVRPLAEELAASIPAEMAEAMAASAPGEDPLGAGEQAGAAPWLRAMAGEVSPAQAEVFRLAMTTLAGRATQTAAAQTAAAQTAATQTATAQTATAQTAATQADATETGATRTGATRTTGATRAGAVRP
jgi:DNA-binding transcriptional MerR regulator